MYYCIIIINAKTTIAHDDVTHGAMARKILKKIIDLANVNRINSQI